VAKQWRQSSSRRKDSEEDKEESPLERSSSEGSEEESGSWGQGGKQRQREVFSTWQARQLAKLIKKARASDHVVDNLILDEVSWLTMSYSALWRLHRMTQARFVDMFGNIQFIGSHAMARRQPGGCQEAGGSQVVTKRLGGQPAMFGFSFSWHTTNISPTLPSLVSLASFILFKGRH